VDNIQFEIRQLLDEFELMKELASDFLQECSLPVFDEIRSSLNSLKSYGDNSMRLEARSNRPIVTKTSKGQYDRKSSYPVYAELCFVWDLEPVIEKSRPKPHRYVQLSGIASTVTQLYVEKEGSPSKIAHWRLEIADSQSPGSYFHAQIPDTLKGSKNIDGMWPSWLPVPRLSVPPFTPMLALEFVLGELFQDKWPEHLNSQSTSRTVGRWRNIHQGRFSSYFKWQQEVIGKSVSPLVALKQAKPESDIFLPA